MELTNFMDFVTEVKLTPEEQMALKELSSKKEYEVLKAVMRRIIQSQLHSVIADNLEKDLQMDTVNDAEGGYRLYKRLGDIIKKINE